MAKALKHYLGHAEQAAGGTLDPRLNAVDLVNESGRHLCSMHEWSFLERPASARDFVASQAYVTLPDDFEQLIAVEVTSAIETTVTQTTMSEILRYRASVLNDPLSYFVAIEYPAQTDTTANQPVPRLAIWPTPGANATGAIQVQYRAGWVELSSHAAYPNIPLEVETLLVELIRAFTRGHVDPKTSLSEELEKIEKSALLSRLKRKYGMVQGSLGQMRGGIVNRSDAGVYRPFRTITSAG